MDATHGPEAALDWVREHIKPGRVAMITAPEWGELESRPMTVLKVDEVGDFWFFCEPREGEAEEYRVNLSYSDEGRANFASISGLAQVVRDRERIHALWTPLALPWFPNGPDAPTLALLRVKAHRVAYWDAPDSKLVRAVALAVSIAKKKPVGLGVHGQAQLASNVLPSRQQAFS